MSNPNPIILSDDEEVEDSHTSPLPFLSKKPRNGSGPHPIPTVLVLDDDPTPQKNLGDSFIADSSMSDVSIVKCTSTTVANSHSDLHLHGNGRLICLDSENDGSEGESEMQNCEENKIMGVDGEAEYKGWSSRLFCSLDSLGDVNLTQTSGDTSSQPLFLQDDISQVPDCPEKGNFSMENKGKIKMKTTDANSSKRNSLDAAVRKKKLTKEERIRLAEEKKLNKEQERMQKAALKAQAAESKKMEKQKKKWEKGKFALKSVVAEFDTKLVEQGSIAGHLLTRFADKGLAYRITTNAIERSITWTMSVPEHISELSVEGSKIQYVILVYEAEEFCNLVINGLLLDHVSCVQNHYPSYTVCFLTNRLMAYINKREKVQYKSPENHGWTCPPIEEVLARLTTHFVRVHYRHCIDEAELAEHIVGLTSSLAACQFRKKLTRLSVNANGYLVPKDSIDRDLIKKSLWLKALIAIPKVQPRFAVSIWKKYPTMKSLLRVYMDPSKSVHEKEFLLEDLTTGLVGGERRVGQICSKRVYRVLMAQSGSIKTDNVEDGADFFTNQSS